MGTVALKERSVGNIGWALWRGAGSLRDTKSLLSEMVFRKFGWAGVMLLLI